MEGFPPPPSPDEKKSELVEDVALAQAMANAEKPFRDEATEWRKLDAEGGKVPFVNSSVKAEALDQLGKVAGEQAAEREAERAKLETNLKEMISIMYEMGAQLKDLENKSKPAYYQVDKAPKMSVEDQALYDDILEKRANLINSINELKDRVRSLS